MSDMNQTPHRPPLDDGLIRPEKPHEPVAILLLAWFLGGIAYFVLGQWQKGIAAVSLWIAALAVVFVTCGVGFLLYLPLIILIIIDAYMQAKLLKDGHAIGQWTFFGTHA